jgi:hypothetical protein
MKFKNKIDRNTLFLHDALEAMTLYSYNDEIEKKLKDFIFYLDNILFKADCHNDIIGEELFLITEYEKDK